MKKILVLLAMTASFLAAINLQKASKDELMCIKGIGEKKAATIIKYRKSHTLKSAKDLLEIKGFGEVLVNNVKKEVKSVACGGKASKKSTTSSKKSENKKSSTKKSDSKKSDSKKSSSKKESKKSDSKKESKKNDSKKSSTKKSDSKKEKTTKKESKKSTSKKSDSKSSSKKSDKESK